MRKANKRVATTIRFYSRLLLYSLLVVVVVVVVLVLDNFTILKVSSSARYGSADNAMYLQGECSL
jgi:hypothetical protein